MSTTTDWSVCAKLAAIKKPKPLDAKGIAELLDLLTPFQITARLKGMEGRELMYRKDGLWLLTDKGREMGQGTEPVAPPRIVRVKQPGAGVVPLPDDSKVPRIKSDASWSIYYIWHRTPKGDFERIDVWVDGEGTEYVPAHALESADAIYVCHNPSIRDKRLRKLEHSSIKRLIDRHDKDQHERAMAKVAAKQKAAV